MDKSGLISLTSGNTIVYSGYDDEHQREVAIAMSKENATCLENWEPTNERLIKKKTAFNSRYMCTKLTIMHQPIRQQNKKGRRVLRTSPNSKGKHPKATALLREILTLRLEVIIQLLRGGPWGDTDKVKGMTTF
jgi:hypothetical protein